MHQQDFIQLSDIKIWLKRIQQFSNWFVQTAPEARQSNPYTASKISFKLRPWPLVHKRAIPTERPPLVGEFSVNFLRVEGVAWSAQRIPTAVNLCFLDRSRYFFIQVAPQLSSRGWVDPVRLKKTGRAGNRTRDLWICSQKLWQLQHRGGLLFIY
jgi:hypothetical protein